MELTKNQIIYTRAGFAKVKSVRSLNQTIQSLFKDAPRKKSKHIPPKKQKSSQPTSPQAEVQKEAKFDPYDFNFGEVFLMLERLASATQTKLKVELDGLIEVEFLMGGTGFISPKYVVIG